MFPVVILGDRVGLREVERDDVAAATEVAEHVAAGDVGPGEWIDWAMAEAEAEPRVRYALAIDRDGVTVGFVSLVVESDEGRGEIGYTVLPAHRRDGIATEAVTLLCRFAFDTLALRRVFALTAVDNVGSVAVLESTGFRREGRLRGHHDAGVDSYVYGRLAADR